MSRLLIACVPFLVAADWPQHLGPNRDGHSPQTGLLRSWPTGGPNVAWQRDVGKGWAGVAVAGDRLVLFHRVGDEEVVECLDPATGKGKWKAAYRATYIDEFEFDNGPRAVPLIADGKVYTLGPDGDLRAWELTTGKGVWARNVNKQYKAPRGFFGVATSPILAGGHLVVNVGAKGAGIVGFDRATGEEVWKSPDDPVSYSSPVTAKLDNRDHTVFFTRNGLRTVDPSTGHAGHTHPFRPRAHASVNAMTTIVSGDRVFLSTAYDTGAVLLEVRKGKLEVVWEGKDILDCHYNTPVFVKDHLYGIDGRQESRAARLRCVEWATGKVKWTKDAFGCAALIYADGLLIACPENGDVVLIEPSPDGYKELARHRVLDEPVRALPALAGGRLFIRDGKKLVALHVGGK
jgi:outer membrane protein assembly factor BamB